MLKNSVLPKNKGFTLIELLIVISIIAILATVGLVVYSSVNKNARDAKRQSDLRTLQSALEQFNSDQFYYPMAATSCSDLKVFFPSPTSPACPLKAGTKTYLNAVPIDLLPAPQPQYSYLALPSSPTVCDNTTATKCSGYCIWAKMENISQSVPPSPCPPTFPSGYNFAVTAP